MSMRSFSRAGIIRQLFNTPLAVLPSTAATVLGVVGPRFDVSQLLMHASGEQRDIAELVAQAAGAHLEIGAKRGLDQRAPGVPAAKVLDVDQGVAHINIRGELIAENGGGVNPSSGFTGYDAINAAWGFAQADSDVRGILLDLDTPGGTVTDLNELAARMMADRGNKPVRAIVRGLGCSAGYAIACCADEVTVQPLSYAGSIGVICMHADFSGQLEQDGVKVTLITAGAHKADGNPFEALPDDVRQSIQANIDVAYGMFVNHVAAARGISADAVRGTEARIYQGQQAVDAGLADKVMGWRDSQAEFVAAVNGRQPPASPKRKAGTAARASQEQTMADTPENAPAANTQPGTITKALAGITSLMVSGGSTEQVAALKAALVADGLSETVSIEPASAAEGTASAERTRVLALVDLCPETTMSASLQAAITGGTEPGAYAIDLAKAAKTRGASVDDLRAGAVQPNQLPAAGTGAIDQGKAKTGAEKAKGILAFAAAAGLPGAKHLAKVG